MTISPSLISVLDVELVQRMRAERLVDMVFDVRVLQVVQMPAAEPRSEHLLGPGHAAFRQRDCLVLFVDDVVAGGIERLALFGLDISPDDGASLQSRNDPVDLVVKLRRFLGGPGDDQWCPRLIDEDAVDFVDDREVVSALDVVRQLELHVVAQVVESELVVGAVGDVGGVGDLAVGVVEIVLDDSDSHAEEAVDPAHPFGVAARQVIVHRNDVDALALERVQVGRQRGDQRLAFAGLHFRDLAFVEDGAADELHVEVPHLEGAPPGLPDHRKGLHQEIVEGLALRDPRPELSGLFAKLVVRQGRDRLLERADLAHNWTQAFEIAFVLGADDFREEVLDHLLRGGGLGYPPIVADGSGCGHERPRCMTRRPGFRPDRGSRLTHGVPGFSRRSQNFRGAGFSRTGRFGARLGAGRIRPDRRSR